MNTKLLNQVFVILILIFCVFRFWNLDGLPEGFFFDEAAVGYNSYLISEAGIDQHGNSYPVFFRAFDDYKNPIYLYTLSFFLNFADLDQWITRLPAAFFGLLTIIISYLISKTIFKSHQAGLWTALLVAANPLHLHFSRIAWQAITISTFFPLAFLAFIKFYNKNTKTLALIAGLCLGLSLYTYSPIKLLALLFFITTSVIILLKTNYKFYLWYLLGLCLTGLPYTLEYINYFDQVNLRLNSIKLDPREYFQAYLSYFTLDFLFIKGDANVRHGDGFGILNLYLAPLLIAGIIQCLKKKDVFHCLLLGLFFTIPILGSLCSAYPHATRILIWIPFCQILACAGIIFFLENFNQKKFSYLFLTLFIAVTTFRLSAYITSYNDSYPYSWHTGLIDALQKSSEIAKPNETINFDESYAYWLFSQKISPKVILKHKTQLAKYTDEFDPVDRNFKYKFLQACGFYRCKDNGIWIVKNYEMDKIDPDIYKLHYQNKYYSVVRNKY